MASSPLLSTGLHNILNREKHYFEQEDADYSDGEDDDEDDDEDGEDDDEVGDDDDDDEMFMLMIISQGLKQQSLINF